MAIINTLQIYDILKKTSLGEMESKAITKVIEKSFEEYKEEQKEFLVTKIDLKEVEVRLIRWMFIFWIGQIGAILGILFVFFK
ncbi:MAG: hypothetical protein AAB732_01005 [Patescibacteria group bacterium]